MTQEARRKLSLERMQPTMQQRPYQVGGLQHDRQRMQFDCDNSQALA
jgi:hypothetical protein